METATRPTAAALNAHLAAGGTVTVTTHLRATTYNRKHEGAFTEGRDKCLYVAAGRGRNCLSLPKTLLVGIRLA